MIEMRIIKHEDAPLEFQYRYKNQLPSGCIPDPFWKEWSEWETAPYVTPMQVEIASMFQDWGDKK